MYKKTFQYFQTHIFIFNSLQLNHVLNQESRPQKTEAYKSTQRNPKGFGPSKISVRITFIESNRNILINQKVKLFNYLNIFEYF